MALIRELLNDKDTMSRLNDNERQTLMQLSQCHHEDLTSPRKRYGDLFLMWVCAPCRLLYKQDFNNIIVIVSRFIQSLEFLKVYRNIQILFSRPGKGIKEVLGFLAMITSA